MKKHPILTVIGILFLVVLVSNIFNSGGSLSETAKQNPAAATQKQKTGSVTAAQVADMVDGVFKNNFPYSYETRLDEESGVFNIDIWSDDITSQSIAETRESGKLSVWNNMVSNLASTTSTIQNAFNENGHDEIVAVMSLCDPVDHSTTFLTIANGVAGYDAVNEIDLLNK